MDELNLRRLALVAVLVGVAVLSWLAYDRWSSPALEISGASVNGEGASPLVGTRVSVSGKVVRVDVRGKVHFLKLSPASPYPLISFTEIDARPGEMIRATGKVKLYKGEPEVVIEKVLVMKNNQRADQRKSEESGVSQ